MKSIAKKTLTVNLVREYSISPELVDLGMHKCTLELYGGNNGTYMVEWNIPTADEYVEIGIFCYDYDNEDMGKEKVVSDYDGVFELSKEILLFLEENGFDLSLIK